MIEGGNNTKAYAQDHVNEIYRGILKEEEIILKNNQ